MSRRLAPYLFAGLLGIVSGVYIFKPLLDGSVATREIRGATRTVRSAVDQPQPDTASEEGK